MHLFGQIWEINPDAIIAEVDLFVAQPDPVAIRKQYLLISKNGSREINNLLGQCLEESGVIPLLGISAAKSKAVSKPATGIFGEATNPQFSTRLTC
jgi:hypothetical protein